MAPSPIEKDLRIAFLGDKNTGKTTYIERENTGKFEYSYIPTTQICATIIKYQTQYGIVNMSLVDGIDEKDENLYEKADGAIVFFSATSMESYKYACRSCDRLLKINPNAPIILCRNKVDDAKHYDVWQKDITYHHYKKNVTFFDVSARSNYHFLKPFLAVMRKCLEHDDLDLEGYHHVNTDEGSKFTESKARNFLQFL